jgi:hypothetical protein
MLMLLPIGLLLVVSGLCFVGCVLDTHGIPPDFTSYSDDDVIGNPNCVAYWRLNDEGPMALDSKGSNNGTYFSKDQPANPNQFPSPNYFQGSFRSALAPGKLTVGAPGIVSGDFVGGPNGSLAGCMLTDGAYVEIGANSITTPPNAFTVEAWISPGWDAADADAVHTFLDFRARDPATGAITGFAMSIDGQGQLNGLIGLGTPSGFQIVGGAVPLQTSNHVVLTLENNMASLFVNGTNTAQMSLPQSYVPNTTARQAIGAGAPFADNRKDQTPDLFFPAFPFNGSIQDVAIYQIALDPITIANHHTNGQGNKTS